MQNIMMHALAQQMFQKKNFILIILVMIIRKNYPN
jgi:hypothetical protein